MALLNDQKGFSVVELIIIVTIVGLLTAVGLFVYRNQNDTNESKTSLTAATKTEEKSKTKSEKANTNEAFVNVVQDDSTVKQVTPAQIAKTADQAAILELLHTSCRGDATYVTVNHVVFDDDINFKQDGGYASINASICAVKFTSLDDNGGSGSRHYLHKNTSGRWVLDVSSQMDPPCSKVDGFGYPSSILTACYGEGDQARAPK